eukprot:TRINITY_DN24023_c1_g1_i1.p1 TRINITY_DN24023_c1_g1~~TRINITY_DN24023_c1_g1_i1.p1  ORF type:complete len:269 (+),score=63.54 TRINITY_DN24023_c1_g1_i1:114-920(+)
MTLLVAGPIATLSSPLRAASSSREHGRAVGSQLLRRAPSRPEPASLRGTACLSLAALLAARPRRVGRTSRPAQDGQQDDWIFPSAISKEEEKALTTSGAADQEPKKEAAASTAAVKEPEPGYATWIMPPSDLPELLKTWASVPGATEEQKTTLESVADGEFRKGWAVWCLSEVAGTDGPGFYIMPPREPQAVAVVDAIDAKQNDVQHILVCPSEVGPSVRQAFEKWVESFKPKSVVMKRPQQLERFGLSVDGRFKGEGQGGAKVSKGL